MPPSVPLKHTKEQNQCFSGHGISLDGCVESPGGEDLMCGYGFIDRRGQQGSRRKML